LLKGTGVIGSKKNEAGAAECDAPGSKKMVIDPNERDKSYV